MTASSAPVPSPALASRVGWLYDGPDGRKLFDQLGQASREEIIALLPEDWDFRGKRILDFGCGAGRILRHFLAEAEHAEMWGCDIDGPSIQWLETHLVPPLNVFQNRQHPPLPLADASFDLVWAASVFTHLGSSWSSWMVELDRILASDGLLLASFIGEGTAIAEAAGWEEDRIGMNVLDGGLSYDQGGATVLHSRWWIRAHWGRAFDIVSLDGNERGQQGWVLMRKRQESITSAQLEAPEPGEPREIEALRHNIAQLEARHRSLFFEHQKRADELNEVLQSRSWRLTAPLRALRHRIARRSGG